MPTPQPILIDGTNWVHWPEPQNQNFGPWLYSGYLYIFVAEELAVSGTSYCRIYKQPYNSPSTPWVEVDAANHPQMNYATAAVYFDGSATVYVAYVHSAVTYLTSFSMATGTWGSTIASFSDHVPQDAIRLHKSGSNYVVYYEADPTGLFRDQAYWRKWDGSSWSSPVRVSDNLASTTRVYAMQMFADESSGLLHLAWRELPLSGDKVLYARTLDPSTGTLGTVRSVTASHVNHRFNPGLEWDSKATFGFGWRDNSVLSSVGGRVYVAYGSPTNDPTWTEETVVTGIPLVQDVWTVKSGTTLYVWWATTAGIYYATKTPGGSWSSPVTWYEWSGQDYLDDDGTTLVPWNASNFFHNGSINNVGSSIEIIIGGYEDMGGGSFISTGFYTQGPTLGVTATNRWYAI